MKKLILLLFIPFVFACSSDSSDDSSPCPNQPQLTTNEVSDISVDAVTDLVSVTFSGEILNIQLGDNCETFSITNQGFVYSTTIQPTIEDNVVNANGESVTVSVDELPVETTYYVRTFITNVLGTFYGNEVNFETPASNDVIIEPPLHNIITTLSIFFTSGNEERYLYFQDLDGDGPLGYSINTSAFCRNKTFSADLQFLNEIDEPPINFTNEIIENSDDYQIFFSASNGFDINFSYLDFDTNGYPLGTQFEMTVGEEEEGFITITLVYEPLKPNDGIENAGGEVLMQVTFQIAVSSFNGAC